MICDTSRRSHIQKMDDILQSLPVFQYRPLDPSVNEIRILRLLPPLGNKATEQSQPISCLLEHVSLDKNLDYFALSYVCGNAEPPSLLSVNGTILQITHNLDVALRHLQVMLKSEHIWIDAVCIDQRDTSEKSVQIPRMRSIYEQAKAVIAWLGPANDESDTAMEALKEIGEKVLHCGSLRKIVAGRHNERIRRMESEVTVPISPLVSLFERGFWRRIWIMQEICLAKVLVFVCGRTTVAWHLFFAGFWALQLFKHAHRIEWRPLGAASSEINFFIGGSYLYNDAYCGSKQPLRTLLEVCRQHTSASNPRDMVFALSGLASDWEELGIHVDYSKSYEELFTYIARAWIKFGDLGVLFQAQNQCQKSAGALPSWVPDWTHPRLMNPIASGFAGDRTFSASGTSSPNDYFGRNECQSRTIVLDGVLVGEVTSISQVWNAEEMGLSLKAISRWLEELNSLLSPLVHCQNTLDKVIWQIPIACRKPVDGLWKPECEILHTAYQTLRGFVQLPEESIETEAWVLRNSESYVYAMNRTADQRKAFTSNEGHLGLGPQNIQTGDLVCILFGSEVPLILRRSMTGTYTLIGDAYVYGIMHGEYIDTNSRTETFEIE